MKTNMLARPILVGFVVVASLSFVCYILLNGQDAAISYVEDATAEQQTVSEWVSRMIARDKSIEIAKSLVEQGRIMEAKQMCEYIMQEYSDLGEMDHLFDDITQELPHVSGVRSE